MPRSTLLALAAALAFPPGPAPADARRPTPGLVIETGARHAVADGVAFSPDGSLLYAWGEDKVIRSWPIGRDGFLQAHSHNLRWPILREQRGSIFTLALTRDGKRL